MNQNKVKLINICSQIRGVSYQGGEASDLPKEGFLPILRANNISDNGMLNFDKIVFIPQSRISDKQKVRQGDIIVAASSGSKEVVGKAAIASEDFNGSFGAFCKLVRPHGVYPKYLGYYFQTSNYRRRISALSEGANINNLRNEHIDNLEIPLPDLPTQKHIASILDKADALRQQNRQLLNYYDELLQSTFIEMFGPKAINHKNWGLLSIEELANREKGSMRTGPFGSDLLHSEFVDDGIFVLGIDNVVNNTFEWNKMRFISPEKYEKLRRYTVKPGDLLISIMATIGRVAVVPSEMPLAINSKHLAAISLDRSIVDSNFIAFNLHSNPEVTKQITANGRGAIMDGLNLGLIRRITMRIPPLRSQIEFVKIQENIEAQKKQVKKSLMESVNIFESLLRNYFQSKN